MKRRKRGLFGALLLVRKPESWDWTGRREEAYDLILIWANLKTWHNLLSFLFPSQEADEVRKTAYAKPRTGLKSGSYARADTSKSINPGIQTKIKVRYLAR